MGLFGLFGKKQKCKEQQQSKPTLSDDSKVTSNKSDLQPYKRVIHSAGAHIMGELYEEVNVEIRDGKYYYATLSMTDRFNAGGHREEIPEDFIVDGKVDEASLLDYVAVTHTYMDTLSYRRDSAKLCSVCRKPIKNTAFKKINNYLLCESCFEKINNKTK